jgi:predicted ester cyclase
MTTSEQNKAIVQQLIAAMNKGSTAEYTQLYCPNCILRGLGSRDISGPESLKEFNLFMHSAFPDIQYTLEEIVAEGDRVAWRFLAQGTHSGQSKGIRPTGKKVTVNGIVMNKFADGRVSEHWLLLDGLDMFRQIGFLPFVK